MYRIYQGRVLRADIVVSPATKKKSEELTPLPDWEKRLWDHHVIFQDATNYYLLALAALADPCCVDAIQDKSIRVLEQFRSKMEEAWERFPLSPASNAKSLRDSVAEWLQLEGDATFDDAIAKVLDGNNISPQVRAEALFLLLEQCSGESAIQHRGKEFLPLFCVKETTANFKKDPRLVQREWDQKALPFIIHRQITDSKTHLLDRFDIYSLATPDNRQPTLNSAKAKERLKNAIQTLAEEHFITSEDQERLSGIVEALPDGFTLPNYWGASAKDVVKLRLYALMTFKYLEKSPATLTALRKAFPEPKEKDTMPEALSTDNLADDPIKIARGERGYVFPAFTALPAWNPSSPGDPVWKEFDIAAFKEALKALNQFNQKTLEREEQEHTLRGELAILLGSELPDWKPQKTEESEEEKRPVPLDSNLFHLARELEATLTGMLDDVVLGEEKSMTFGNACYSWREGQWQVTDSALRGLNDLVEKWQKAYNHAQGNPKEEDLVKIVKDYQSDEENQRKMGSVPLFLTLCEKRFWPLWLNPNEERASDSDEEDSTSSGGASFLRRMAAFHRTFRDYQRSKEPINLTPAEPVYSRRLYMKDKAAKVRFSNQNGELFFTCALAMKNEGGQVAETTVRLYYSGRRLLRDELQGGVESRWIQPMTKALSIPSPEQGYSHAVALMPEFPKRHVQKGIPADRFLLNFPVDLDISHIHTFLGKATRWKGQFNGTRDKNLHLHWPATINTKSSKTEPWWKDPNIIANGFTTLSVDLGQRTAGAWALLKVTCRDPRECSNTKRPVRKIGHDGSRTWFAEVLHTGLLRLPGEDQYVRGKDGKFTQEHYGKKGRYAREHEWTAALELACALKADKPGNWVGSTCREKSLPEQNDSLIALANRRLSRLNTFHRWSCFAPNAEAANRLEKSRIEKLKAELDHWQDPEVQNWRALLDQGDIVGFSQAAGEGFLKLQNELTQHLVTLANRTVPLRGRSWVWQPKANAPDGLYRELVDSGKALPGEKVWIRGQRGLTLARIEQLENLRKLFLRHNRSFDRKPGEKAKFGVEDRGRASGEPCELLLQKIERMKEQRINQTAHLILAEALGVKLKKHEVSDDERRKRDIHGEYEVIPGRQPVDFIIIENLDRYLASQGRAPSENSRLMKWAHRAIRDKIKMLAEEPFGIPVVETTAAYSSQFCAVSGSAGARCEECSALDPHLKEQLKKWSQESAKPGQPNPLHYRKLLDQFNELEGLNRRRQQIGKPPYSLYLPKKGGPLFISLPNGKPQQADINAAINIGLRALVAPEALDILHRVRAEKGDNSYQAVQRNAREKAAFKSQSTISITGDTSDKLAKSTSPNFFYDGAKLATFDCATLSINGESFQLASGVSLWSSVKTIFLERLIKINEERLKQWRQKLSREDDIPM